MVTESTLRLSDAELIEWEERLAIIATEAPEVSQQRAVELADEHITKWRDWRFPCKIPS